MKKFIILFTLSISTIMNAQDQKSILPQVSVSGEGKIKVIPDQLSITIGAENVGKDIKEVKKLNDEKMASIIKVIKKYNIPTTDYQLTNVNLYRSFENDKKKYNYTASQTISILIKDLKIYNEFMFDINESGVTTISGLEYKSSKIELLEKEARKKAMLNAKQKAEDYVSVLNQKVGKALQISDNSNTYYPQPVLYQTKSMDYDASAVTPETLSPGEITINASVQVTFLLE